MNSRGLRLLSGAALLIVIAALWLGHSRSPQNTEPQSLYPDLKGKLASVTSVAIFKAGDQLATELSRDGSVWKVKQRFDFPADAAKVNSLLISLDSAVLREQKTANAANYGALSVQDLSDAATTGVRVELAGTPSPVKLIVGKRDQASRSTYVRRAGEPQSWLIGSELEVAAEPTQWLKHEIVNIGADRIQEIAVRLSSSPNATPYSVFKNARADANFDVKGLPKGRELNSVAAANSAAQALTSLQLEDVRPASEVATEKNPSHAVFRTFEGAVIECTGYTMGDKRWITIKAGFDSELAKRFHLPTEPAKDSDSKDKKAATQDTSIDALIKKGQEEVAALNAATSAWAYAVPTYKYDTIFKPLEDLLKKPEMLKKGK